jgi:hypothetical protein
MLVNSFRNTRLNVGEHAAFGGVGKGHAPTGYHPVGMAIDVRDWRPDMAPAYSGGKPKQWKERTGELSYRAKKLGLFNEALGPGDKGHDTHVHLALEGKKPITEQQLEWLATGRTTQGGKLTDVMPGAVPEAPVLPTPAQNTDTLMESLFGKQKSLKDVLTASLLQQALARRQETQVDQLSLANPYKSMTITPEQAMQLFA